MEELFNLLLDKNISISVVGDTLIDEYYHVDVSRLSPEFPVPVLQTESLKPYKSVCGGAANVVNQFKHFHVTTSLISILNHKALELTDEQCIDSWASYTDVTCHVPIKKRFYHQDHPIIRIDVEKSNYGLENIEEISSNLKIPKSDIVIYSDYNKGLFTKNYKINKKQKCLVDPKVDMSIWNGCYLFKPNYNEAVKLTGHKDIKKQINFILKNIKCKNVVITKGGDGVFGYGEHEGYIEIISSNKLKPESVIGAGDAYLAFLGMSLACGFSLRDAMEHAFKAGTIYVSRKYNQPLCMADFFVQDKFIKNWEFLANRNFKLVVTGGCYDVVHLGHMHTLKEAKKYGDKLCVTLNSDQSIKRLKGEKRPIMPLESRIEVLKSLEFVDFIVVFDEDTPENVLSVLKPDVYCKGSDYKNKILHGSQNAKEVVYIDMIDGYSTTKFCG